MTAGDGIRHGLWGAFPGDGAALSGKAWDKCAYIAGEGGFPVPVMVDRNSTALHPLGQKMRSGVKANQGRCPG